MKNIRKQSERNIEKAFSLVEMLVVVALAAMIMVGTLGVYNRVRSDATVILEKLDENRLDTEVLQRIAEDLDRIVAPGFDAAVRVQNKMDNGLSSAQLIISNKYYGDGTKPKAEIYEQVVWQSRYDAFEDAMILYRMHSGLNVEDKILDENKEDRELSMYIPIVSGVTFFEIQAVQDQKLVQNWTQTKLPSGLRIGISFAELQEGIDGRWVVPQEKIIYRDLAVDRTRAITYKFKPKVFDANDFLMPDDSDFDQEPEEDLPDPNKEEEDKEKPVINPEDVEG